MNQDYKIHRWDSVIMPNNKGLKPIQQPMIYIKPDETLLQFATDNHNELLVDISFLPLKKVRGRFYKSSDIYNMSNLFKVTGLYVIVLDIDWDGYPDNLGVVNIFGYNGGVCEKDLIKNKEADEREDKREDKREEKREEKEEDKREEKEEDKREDKEDYNQPLKSHRNIEEKYTRGEDNNTPKQNCFQPEVIYGIVMTIIIITGVIILIK